MVKVNKIVYFASQNGTNLINMLQLEERAGITTDSAYSGRSDTRSDSKLSLRHAAVGKQFTQINFYHKHLRINGTFFRVQITKSVICALKKISVIFDYDLFELSRGEVILP